MPRKGDRKPIRERIERLVRREGKHWIWTAHCTKQGVPQIRAGTDYRPMSARRVVYTEYVGPLPEDTVAVRSDCNVAACVAPGCLVAMNDEQYAAYRANIFAKVERKDRPFRDAVDGPCHGHECDHCSICQRGRCCRSDMAEYHLPLEGDWAGVLYASIGVLEETVDGLAVCHACGKAFGNLYNHAWRMHNLTVDEYRAVFGLNRRQGVIGSKTRALRQTPEALARFAAVRPAESALRGLTREQRSAASARPRRRQTRLERVRVATGVCPICGERFETSASRKRVTCGRDECVRKRMGEGIARSRSLRAAAVVESSCLICGGAFEHGPAQKRSTCGKPECVSERRRRLALEDPITRRRGVRRKLSVAAKRRRLVRDDAGRIVTWERMAEGG